MSRWSTPCSLFLDIDYRREDRNEVGKIRDDIDAI
jgi:hypothetical protein